MNPSRIMAQPSSSPALGPYVRLAGLSIKQLPTDGHRTTTTSTTATSSSTPDPSLRQLISSILNEAIPFIDGAAPKSGSKSTWTQKSSAKRFPASDAAIYSSSRVVSGPEIDAIAGMDKLSADKQDEAWFCRRSVHRNESKKGTASWEEFRRAFKEQHPQTEDAFTAAVIGAREGIEWDTSGIEVEAHGGRWVDSKLAMVEMKHKIPAPLKNRTFPILQLSSSLAGAQEFLVVSIPVLDFGASPDALFAKESGLVVAAYVAIERIRVLPATGEIEWIMATASDAGGVLPQWMQRLAVPGKLTEDVDMFLSWIPSQRKKEEERPKPVTAPTNPATDKSLPQPPQTSETTSLSTVPPPPISKTVEQDPGQRSGLGDKSLPAAPAQ